MTNNSSETKYKNELIEIITKYIPDCKIYLFGSRAYKTHQEASDIDIAIYCNNKIEHLLLAHIRSDIDDSNIPFFVDVVDFNCLPKDLQETILKRGILWKN